VELLVVMTVLGLLMAIMLPTYARARATSEYGACKENLAQMATAFEMYAGENGGIYPNRADLIVPRFIAYMPTCPSVGIPNYRVQTWAYPHAFTIYCRGEAHALAGAPPDFPQYRSGHGMIAP